MVERDRVRDAFISQTRSASNFSPFERAEALYTREEL